MKHTKEIKGFETKSEKPLKHLANLVGDLDYVALAEFLSHLSIKLKVDSLKDIKANRTKLGETLESAAAYILCTRECITEAKVICEPYMPKGDFGWRNIPIKDAHWSEQAVYITNNDNGKEVFSEPLFILKCNKSEPVEVVLLDCKTNFEHTISTGSRVEGYGLATKLMS